MEGIKAFLAALGINPSSALFGLLGATLAALRHKECPWWENLITFFTGLGLSTIGPSFVIQWFHLDPDPAYFGGIGFVCGYFGMSLMDEVMLIIRSAGKVDWAALIQEKLGGKGKE